MTLNNRVMVRNICFKEFLLEDENDTWTSAGTRPGEHGGPSRLKHLENNIYGLINQYRDYLVRASKEGGEKDDNIHHDIIKKDEESKSMLNSIAQLFANVYDMEKGSPKLKPSFFSDTVFEKIARYARKVLGYHADDIGLQLRKINPESSGYLFDIWKPGSWLGG